MTARVGDRIVVESDKVGQPAREGEILAIIPHETGTEYEVRWDDGHRTSIRPHGGTARIVPKTKARAGN